MAHIYFLFLWFLCILGSFTVIPYASLLANKLISFSLTQILLMILQNSIIYGLAIKFGKYFSEKINIKFVLLDSNSNITNFIKSSLIAGSICAVLLVIMDLFVFQSPFNELTQKITPLMALGGALYGGVNEEVLMRLFLLSMIIYFFSKIIKLNKNFSFWLSVILIALIFGIAHLPAAARISGLNLHIITRVITLNAIAGVIFGWLFVYKGFEVAVLAHFICDLIIYVILNPLINNFFSFIFLIKNNQPSVLF